MTGSEERAIEQLLSEFAWLADRGQDVALAELFLPDGILTVGGTDLLGREAIAADCRRRCENPARKTRHVWSNLRFESVDAGRIKTSAIQMTWEQLGLGTKLRVNDLFDTFAKDEIGRWRFSRRLISRQIALDIAPRTDLS